MGWLVDVTRQSGVWQIDYRVRRNIAEDELEGDTRVRTARGEVVDRVRGGARRRDWRADQAADAPVRVDNGLRLIAACASRSAGGSRRCSIGEARGLSARSPARRGSPFADGQREESTPPLTDPSARARQCRTVRWRVHFALLHSRPLARATSSGQRTAGGRGRQQLERPRRLLLPAGRRCADQPNGQHRQHGPHPLCGYPPC